MLAGTLFDLSCEIFPYFITQYVVNLRGIFLFYMSPYFYFFVLILTFAFYFVLSVPFWRMDHLYLLTKHISFIITSVYCL